MTDELKSETKFNSGLDKLKRIGDLKRQLHTARLCGDINTMLECLISISRELYERMQAEGIEVIKEANKLERNCRFMVETKLFHRNIILSSDLVNMTIANFENFLNRKEFEYGMSMPNKDDSRYSIGH